MTEQPDVAVAEPVRLAAKLGDGSKLGDELPMVAHQALAPQPDLELRYRAGEQVEKGGKVVGLAEKWPAVVAPVENVEGAAFEHAASNP